MSVLICYKCIIGYRAGKGHMFDEAQEPLNYVTAQMMPIRGGVEYL